MDITKYLQKAKGQTLAMLAIGGAVTILIVASVLGAVIASNVITDATVLILVGLITLVVSVVVLMQILSAM